MNQGRTARGLSVALAIFGVLGVASAQDAPPPAPTAPAATTATEPELSPQQMLTQAKGFLPAMDRAAVNVRRQLTVAREQKDVVKSLCLNDKLNQIDLATRTATDRVSDLEAGVSANDTERSKHQYTVILVLRDRVNTLVSEANQCIGEDVGFVGDSNVTMTIDGDIPPIDPSDFPNDPIVSQPPVVSPPDVVSNMFPATDET
ncbi:MAG TPA: hypothetical protein VFZ53_19130 [Polyangiaceae bacterium]